MALQGWKVDPHGVLGVLQAVGKVGDSLEVDLAPLDYAVKAIAPAADGRPDGSETVCRPGLPSAGLITAALNEFMAVVSADLETIGNRVDAASNGLASATEAVAHGDEEMAERTQAAAAGVVPSGLNRMGRRMQ